MWHPHHLPAYGDVSSVDVINLRHLTLQTPCSKRGIVASEGAECFFSSLPLFRPNAKRAKGHQEERSRFTMLDHHDEWLAGTLFKDHSSKKLKTKTK